MKFRVGRFLGWMFVLGGWVGCGGNPLDKGWKAYRDGNADEARAAFESFTKDGKWGAQAYAALASLDMEQLKDADAENRLSAGLAAYPNDPALLCHYGEILLLQGREAEAYQAFSAAMDAAPEGEHVRRIAGILGDAYTVMRLTSGERDSYSPVFAPDGKSIVYTSHIDGNAELFQMDLNTRNVERVAELPTSDEYGANFSPDGKKLLFGSAQRATNAAIITLQASGSTPRNELVYIYDFATKTPTTLTTTPGPFGKPVFTPDGKRIAFEASVEGNLDVWTMDLDGKDRKRLTSDLEDDGQPMYRPDGKSLVFISLKGENFDLMEMKPDGAEMRHVTTTPVNEYGGSFSPDGKQFVYMRTRGLGIELALMDWESGRSWTIARGIGDNLHPTFSPDGKSIVFASNRSDYLELYLMDLTKPIGADALRRQIGARLAGK